MRLFKTIDKKQTFDTGLRTLKTGITLLVIKDLIFYLILAENYFGRSGIVPYSIYTDILNYLNLSFLDVLFHSNFTIYLFLAFSTVIAIFFLFNYYNLLSGLLLFICLVIIRLRNIYIMDGGDNLYALLVFFLAFYQPIAQNTKAKIRGGADCY